MLWNGAAIPESRPVVRSQKSDKVASSIGENSQAPAARAAAIDLLRHRPDPFAHMKAKQRGVKARTSVFRDNGSEGLRFQFYEPGSGEPLTPSQGGHTPPAVSGGEATPEPDPGHPEEGWHREMLNIHAEARAIGYSASRFIQMLNERGGLAAAKGLIDSDQPSEGFTKLWKLQRLDISVEARALKPEYRALFEPAEIKKCRDRLAAYEWNADPPWRPPRAASRS